MNRHVSFVVGAMLLFATLGSAQEDVAQQHFARGKQLIEANGADTMGATRQGLEKGIAEVIRAIEANYADQVAAYKLLASAYNTLALVYAKPDSQEQKEMLLLRRQTLEKLLELAPDDARIRYEYATALNDAVKQIAALREILAENPSDAQTRYSLGILLVHGGQVEEGVSHLKKAVDLAGLYWGQIYGRIARDVLLEKGRKAEAAEIRTLIETKKETFLLPKQTVEKLSGLQPGKGRMRAELGRVVKDPAKRIGSLYDILRGDSTNTRVRYSLGMALVFNGQVDEGVMHLKLAVESSDPSRAQIYGGIARNFLIEEGKKAEAEEIAKLMAKKKPKPN